MLEFVYSYFYKIWRQKKSLLFSRSPHDGMITFTMVYWGTSEKQKSNRFIRMYHLKRIYILSTLENSSTSKWHIWFIQRINTGSVLGTYLLITTSSNSKLPEPEILKLGWSVYLLRFLPIPELSAPFLIKGIFPWCQSYPSTFIPLLPMVTLTCLLSQPQSRNSWQR